MRELADKIDDVTRLLTRQAAAIAALTDARAATGPDVPLLVDLHALLRDSLACAATARSRRERAAFTAVAAGLERLVVGRGGALVTPAPGEAFRGTQMEAVEVVPTDDPAQDRTVARLLEPGLDAAGRSVRPARVAVFRAR
ncbi:hypothetical protein GCM10017691_32820 [Pseudonocardia petroleophila]|uniref:Nucleotide exchange factor GrpE n=1 Tax=Pseudonocardia petroleophila TaxID=37331 RepID=A0A7G7MDP6_9PSEU|nr:nucleotide exchange factor GrpE [Pseudonocardia petroleophila]QNG50907.1 nucleotide exchange factor GrpE [Pseudonocardia petroleophila]